MNARTSVLAVRIDSAALGNRSERVSATSSKRASTSAAWDRTADMFARQFPKVKELMDLAKGDVLAFTAFPADHWRKIWSNNPLERLNK